MTALSAGPAAERGGPAGPVRAFLRLVVIEHSVFALPFAYVAALTAMADRTGHVVWWRLVVITVAMVAGRTFAMAANRIIDRHIDAQNPRTAGRELVTGTVSLRTAWTGALVALAAFFAAAAALGPLCLVLAPVAVLPLIGYSYTKRFTWAPHAVLGLAQAVAPVGAWMGVTDSWSWPAAVLGLAVGTWIGGFDLIYACQDVDADRRIGVHSFPVRWGVRASLWTSAVTHVFTFALFGWFGVIEGLGGLWYVGLGLTVVAFCYEHAIVRAKDLSRLGRAFFTANGVVGLVLFGFTLADLVAVQGLGG
ncbi:MAG TPA: menaquinone biosynthesis prenyltransferase MqnP [Mycobacteriales bacterium]|nr:menaquinone biosynthesis prenyltransferase MqnP [Mycobacteriales bacterium]